MGKMLKDKIGNKQEFSFWVFFDLFKRWKWMEIIHYHKPFSKNYNKLVGSAVN